MNVSMLGRAALLSLVLASLSGSAVSEELPVLVPSLPPRVVAARIPFSFDTFHSATATADGKALHLDLGDETLQGTYHLGIYPFGEGDADLAYTRFRFSGPFSNGKVDLPVAAFLGSTVNVNGWPDGLGLFPPTMTVTARLDVLRQLNGGVVSFGPVDGRFSFRMSGTAVLPAVTIVEGPLLGRVESGDPTRVSVSWRTDRTATGRVRIVPAGGPLARTAASSDTLVAGGTEFSAAPERGHKVSVTGLRPSTRYRYLVESAAEDGSVARSPVFEFTTAPAAGKGEVKFLAVSDAPDAAGGGERAAMGINRQVAEMVATRAAREAVDLVLFGGDLVYGFADDAFDYRFQLRAWKDAWAPFWHSAPVYAVPGNHETLARYFQDGTPYGLGLDRWPYSQESAEVVFADEFDMPTNGPVPDDPRRPPYTGTAYSFQYGPVLFVGLNDFYWWSSDAAFPRYGGAPEGYLMDDQLRWFENVMTWGQKSPKVKFIVVFLHEPPFPPGPFTGERGLWWDGNNAVRPYVVRGNALVPAGDGVIDVRNRFWRVLARNPKTAALVAGHQHGYSRLLVDSTTPVGILPQDDTDGDGVLDRFSPNPDFTLPVWQIVSGNGGANYYAYAREGKPWTAETVSNQEGYCIFRTRNDTISMTSYALSGQVVDHVDDLMAVKRR